MISDITGSLPHSLPGSFNAVPPLDDVPYGSVGFTLVCRSVVDFVTVLAVVQTYVSMGYTEELSGEGAGRVTLDLEDPLFKYPLPTGQSPQALLEKDNLWEVYFDGERRFQWLGQNVEEPQISSSEESSVTISGPGIAATLDWSKFRPNYFPEIATKLSALRDDFEDSLSDVWTEFQGSHTLNNGEIGIAVAGAGTSGSSYIGTDILYDFDDSGVEVRVEPYIAPAGVGHVKTIIRIESPVSQNYVAMSVERQSVSPYGDILVCETRSGATVHRREIPYLPTMAYLRIQESDGVAIFSTRDAATSELPDPPWTEHARFLYYFDLVFLVALRLQLVAVAGANLTLPKTSYFSELSVNGVESVHKPLEVYRRYLLAQQASNRLTHIVPTWTETHDSVGNPWEGNTTSYPDLGVGYLVMLKDYCDSYNCDWKMGPNFDLLVYQRQSAVPEPTVIFHEEVAQLSRRLTRTYKSVVTSLIGRTSSGVYTQYIDSDATDEFNLREDMMTDSIETDSVHDLRQILQNRVNTLNKGTSSWTLEIPFNVEGARLYRDFNVGSVVVIHKSDPFELLTRKVMAVSVQVSGDGDPQIELILESLLKPFWQQVRENTQRIENKVNKAFLKD